MELKRCGYIVSIRKIGLVSNYTVKQYKTNSTICNNKKTENVLDRQFNQEKRMNVVVSDLTYVNVVGKWKYTCLMLDLYNREIVGCEAGEHKSVELVKKVLYLIKYDLSKITLFHTDRGHEFKTG